MAYYVRIGSFTILPSQDEHDLQDDANLKQGGNVGSFFCNPGGQVFHAVAGPVQANTLLSQARWARTTYDQLRLGRSVRTKLRQAHAEQLTRVQQSLNANTGELFSIHTYLSRTPLVPVEDFSREVFTYLLHEPVDGGDTPLHFVDQTLAQARQARSAMVLVIYQGDDPLGLGIVISYKYGTMPVVAMSLSDSDMRELEQRQGWAEHASPERGRVRCVVLNAGGREIDNFLVRANSSSIQAALAQGRDRDEETQQEAERRQIGNVRW